MVKSIIVMLGLKFVWMKVLGLMPWLPNLTKGTMGSSFINRYKCRIINWIQMWFSIKDQSDVSCIGDVMVSMLALKMVDHGFEPQSGQTINYKIGVCCFSVTHAELRRKIGWHEIMIMCVSGVTCLPVECCFSELTL